MSLPGGFTVWHLFDCRGTGYQHSTELFRGKRVDVGVPCSTCQQAGTITFDFVVCEQCGEACCDCPEPEPPAPAVVWNNGTVNAPGFDSDTFAAAFHRAQARGYIHIRPGKPGRVRVDIGRDTEYVVTRTGCTCSGHADYGHCPHRAAAVFVNDVAGIDLCHIEIIGFDRTGDPVIVGGAVDRQARVMIGLTTPVQHSIDAHRRETTSRLVAQASHLTTEFNTIDSSACIVSNPGRPGRRILTTED